MRITYYCIAAIVLAATGCGTSSLAEEYCSRLDSCNNLARSVDECVQDSENVLQSLPKNQRDEVEFELKMCLERPSCDGFGSCVFELVK